MKKKVNVERKIKTKRAVELNKSVSQELLKWLP